MRKYRRLRAFLGISVAPTAVPPDKPVSQSPIPVFLQHEQPLAEGAWNLTKNDTVICGIGTLAHPPGPSPFSKLLFRSRWDTRE